MFSTSKKEICGNYTRNPLSFGCVFRNPNIKGLNRIVKKGSDCIENHQKLNIFLFVSFFFFTEFDGNLGKLHEKSLNFWVRLQKIQISKVFIGLYSMARATSKTTKTLIYLFV